MARSSSSARAESLSMPPRSRTPRCGASFGSPKSARMSWAVASGAARSSARMAWRVRAASVTSLGAGAPEVDLRDGALGLRDGQLGSAIEVEHARQEVGRELADCGVVRLRHVQVVAARDRDAVLRALELRLQVGEVAG